MTLPRADSDKLILVASLNRSPTEPAFDCHSNWHMAHLAQQL